MMIVVEDPFSVSWNSPLGPELVALAGIPFSLIVALASGPVESRTMPDTTFFGACTWALTGRTSPARITAIQGIGRYRNILFIYRRLVDYCIVGLPARVL